MRIRVLGCSGGVGTGLKTTSFLIDDDILIDAGSGVGDLTLDEMAKIRHIFVTHSHLDHITSIPFLLDSVFERIEQPIQIHAQAMTIRALKEHVFNNVIWPDFACLPNHEQPVLAYQEMSPESRVELDGRTIEMIPVNHVVPAVGYSVCTPKACFAFSGDTTTNDSLWQHLNQMKRLDLLFVEAAFPDDEMELALVSKHYSPLLLAKDLAKLEHQPQVYISHNKPGMEVTIFEECKQAIKGHTIHRLTGGATFQLPE